MLSYTQLCVQASRAWFNGVLTPLLKIKRIWLNSNNSEPIRAFYASWPTVTLKHVTLAHFVHVLIISCKLACEKLPYPQGNLVAYRDSVRQTFSITQVKENCIALYARSPTYSLGHVTSAQLVHSFIIYDLCVQALYAKTFLIRTRKTLSHAGRQLDKCLT